ncbi:MAG: hypothetical protein KJ709_05145 [Nanoarchaeota archaeon]|nr:hypothetical protein [Nanoarchaeota archaeon]
MPDMDLHDLWNNGGLEAVARLHALRDDGMRSGHIRLVLNLEHDMIVANKAYHARDEVYVLDDDGFHQFNPLNPAGGWDGDTPYIIDAVDFKRSEADMDYQGTFYASTKTFPNIILESGKTFYLVLKRDLERVFKYRPQG